MMFPLFTRHIKKQIEILCALHLALCSSLFALRSLYIPAAAHAAAPRRATPRLPEPPLKLWAARFHFGAPAWRCAAGRGGAWRGAGGSRDKGEGQGGEREGQESMCY